MTNFTTSTPHDALFKSFLTHSDTARDFMEIHLPKDLRELCDLDSLKLESASFVDEKLRALHSDILWSVKTREGDGYIYVVIEHQSREDIHMAFRLMRYSMAVMQRHIEHDTRRHLIRYQCAGLICFTHRNWRDASITVLSRWWISLSCQTTRLCSIAESPCWS